MQLIARNMSVRVNECPHYSIFNIQFDMQNIVLYLIDLGAEWMRSLSSIKTFQNNCHRSFYLCFAWCSYEDDEHRLNAVPSLFTCSLLSLISLVLLLLSFRFRFRFVSLAMQTCANLCKTEFNDSHTESDRRTKQGHLRLRIKFNDIHE